MTMSLALPAQRSKSDFVPNDACALPGKAAIVQKSPLFRGGGAAEHGVAVREAAEPANDVGMQFGPFDRIGVAGCAVEGDAALLVGEIFRMLERQIEERPLGDRDDLVETARERARRGRARPRRRPR